MVRSRKEMLEERIALRRQHVAQMKGASAPDTVVFEEEAVGPVVEVSEDETVVEDVEEPALEEEVRADGDDESIEVGAESEPEDMPSEDEAYDAGDAEDGSSEDIAGDGRVHDSEPEPEAEVDEAPVPRVRPKKRANARPAQIRDFPRSLLDLCKSYFPGATATEALAAYVLMKSGEFSDDIPDAIVALAKTGDDGDRVAELNDRMKRVEGKLDNMARTERRILLAVGHLVANYDGFTKHVPTTPRDIDFLEETDGLFVRLAEQEARKHKSDSASEGRPKKGASKREKGEE